MYTIINYFLPSASVHLPLTLHEIETFSGRNKILIDGYIHYLFYISEFCHFLGNSFSITCF